MPSNQSTSGFPSNTSDESSPSSTAVALVSPSSSSSSPAAFFQPGPSSIFIGMSTLVAENIFNCLDDKSLRAYFRVFVTNNDAEYEPIRQAALNSIQWRFLQFVADAEMKSAEGILKLAMLNQPILQRLLTIRKTITQKNGLPVTGTALEIALKCWDWLSYVDGQEEMAEMLMRYMHLLSDGEHLIQATRTKLLPKGLETHQTNQKRRAKDFAQTILKILAETIRTASDADIDLVYEMTEKQDNEVDSYIENTLVNNSFWKKLMDLHEEIKKFIIKDRVYNPLYLKKAFEIVDRNKRDWTNLSKWDDRLALLTIHGVGGIQAFSPTFVVMLFARGGLSDLNFDMCGNQLSKFTLDRSCEFEFGGSDVFARSGGGIVLCSKMFWAGASRNNMRSGTTAWWESSHVVRWGQFVSQKPSNWKPVSEFNSAQSRMSMCVIQ